MASIARTRIIVALITAATSGLALVLGEGIPADLQVFLRTFAPTLFGAALSHWLLFRFFGRKSGVLGWVLDALAYVMVIALSGLIVGNLLLPGVGTVLGPVLALALPARHPLAALAYLAGAAVTIALIRKAQASP